MVINPGKNIIKNLNGKYSYKLLDHANQSATDALKSNSKKPIQKIASRITKVSKTLQQSNWETVTNEHERKIPDEYLYI